MHILYTLPSFDRNTLRHIVIYPRCTVAFSSTALYRSKVLRSLLVFIHICQLSLYIRTPHKWWFILYISAVYHIISSLTNILEMTSLRPLSCDFKERWKQTKQRVRHKSKFRCRCLWISVTKWSCNVIKGTRIKYCIWHAFRFTLAFLYTFILTC